METKLAGPARLVIGMLVLGLLTGCFSFSDRSFRPVTQSITQQFPELNLQKEVAFSVGSMTLNMIDVVAFGVDFDFSAIDNVEVAVYQTHGLFDVQDANVEQALITRNEKLNWQTVVRVRETGENVWVMVGIDERRGEIAAVSLFVLERTELVLVNVSGDIRHLINFALQPVKGGKGVLDLS